MSNTNKSNAQTKTTPQYTIDSITRYQKNSVKKIGTDFFYDTDKPAIEMLDNIKNMSGYIKSLVLIDINKNPNPIIKSQPKRRRYNNSECRRISFLVNKVTEKDILSRLSLYPNRSEYIRSLVINHIQGL